MKPDLKLCRRCDKQKPVDQFNKHEANPDGKQSYCKQCKRDYKQERKKKRQEWDLIFFNPTEPAF